MRRTLGLIIAFGLTLDSGHACERDREFARAVELYHDRHYREARVSFAALANDTCNAVDVAFYRGRLALWFDEAAEALEQLERAATLAPSDARLHNALGDASGLMAQRATVLAKLGWATKCRTAFERAIELAPANVAFRWSLLGFCCVAPRFVGGGRENALTHAAAIRRLDASAGRAAFATVHLAFGDADAAFAEFEE
ncbi:MAG TPA: hypothetical protein VEQ65_06360, partial [Opitutus sp.]|nr:hypothetical protein [Opitutus sp.]